MSEESPIERAIRHAAGFQEYVNKVANDVHILKKVVLYLAGELATNHLLTKETEQVLADCFDELGMKSTPVEDQQ
ncbi:hypothetical protein [Niveispirillum sp.]|uniref:hypothetical protein n=1 Tax=Niveispirillum sp. TaxID=1917217 RepID=UPI001B6E03BC|nr:hypothetical protein [Niveispirillum sp.]MBP7336897.1 hypothetical protein [Niveispirillum sp.]